MVLMCACVACEGGALGGDGGEGARLHLPDVPQPSHLDS